MTQEEQDALARRTLAQSGIGARYARMRLADFGTPGLTLKATIDDDLERLKSGFALGMGYVFEGGSICHDLAMTFAKALLYCEMNVKVTTLPDLIDVLTSKDEKVRDRIYDLLDCDVLVMTRMFDISYPELPFENSARYRVESFLLNMIDDEAGMILVGSGPLSGSSWWSETFMTRLGRTGSTTISI